MNIIFADKIYGVKPPDKCDYSRNLSPPLDAQATHIKRKNYGVIVTVWNALCNYDTAGAALVISLDTEYQFCPETKTNIILSYQVTAFGRGRKMAQLIFHIPNECVGHRLSLGEIVEETRRALEIKPGALAFKKRKPGAIRVIAHFATAEWAALRDRRKLASLLQIVRKSPVTLGAQKIALKLSNRMISCGLEVVDTTLLAPGGYKSLAAIGDVLNFPKISLPPGAKESMGSLRRSDPALFELYAITDTRVALAFYLEIERISRDVLGLDKLPPTLGAMATAKYLEVIGDDAYLEYFGLERVKDGRKTVSLQAPGREQIESFAAAAFAGGLNMAYPRKISDCLILDIDFTSCYPSAGATLPALNWSARSKTDHEDVTVTPAAGVGTPISISYVNFEFPNGCARPCIPVSADTRGLIYPRKGTGFATHFELAAAYKKGARIEVLREEQFESLRAPDGRPILAFAEFFQIMIEERNKYPKGSLENLTYKELANSAYGKLAQGVQPRRMKSFDSLNALPPSAITCPVYACAITGLVRAALIELMDAAEEVGGVVLAATTDGAMIAFPDIPYRPKAEIDAVLGLMDAIMSKPAIAALSQGRTNSGADPCPVEVKHVGDNAVVMKTRGYILRAGTAVQHIAKCGHQIHGSADAQGARLDAYHTSDEIGTWHVSTLSSTQKIWDRKVKDLIKLSEERRVNVDFDFKIIPDGFGGFRPPEDLQEFLSIRETVDNIRRHPKPDEFGHTRPAKRATIDRVLISRAGIRIRGSEEESLRRMFLYAITQDIAGLYPRDNTGRKITQSALADRAGISVTDIKNAKRRSYIPPPKSEIALQVLQDLLRDTHHKDIEITPEMEILFA